MRGKIVLVPFPFDDLSTTRVRPAVCLTEPLGPYGHSAHGAGGELRRRLGIRPQAPNNSEVIGSGYPPMGFIAENWQFLVNVLLALVAIGIAVKALRDAQEAKEALMGTGPDLFVRWRSDEGTICAVNAMLYPVRDVTLKICRQTRHADYLETGVTREFVFDQRYPIGTPWEITFGDPASPKKVRRMKDVVRYS